jgi:SAM-dependent methyltransferase
VSRDPIAERLLREVWSRDARYYARAGETVRAGAAAGGEYAFLDARLPPSGRVLEVGCGEGSNLVALSRTGRTMFGCDLSALAAGLARGRAGAGIAVAEAERLPYADGSFDAVVAISVLEHLPEPERGLAEMVRVLAPGGVLGVVSPQYGGPLGASPNRRGGGATRFFRRWLRSHRPLAPAASLRWERVRPRVLDEGTYEGDLDAVCEPELRSLRAFLAGCGLDVVASSSGYAWHSWREWRGTAAQRLVRGLFEALGRSGIPPYRDFGPLVVVAARRRSRR